MRKGSKPAQFIVIVQDFGSGLLIEHTLFFNEMCYTVNLFY